MWYSVRRSLVYSDDFSDDESILNAITNSVSTTLGSQDDRLFLPLLGEEPVCSLPMITDRQVNEDKISFSSTVDEAELLMILGTFETSKDSTIRQG
jgi:hypothetical protein